MINLSEKIQRFEGWHSKDNRFIHITYIKEFINQLRDGLNNPDITPSSNQKAIEEIFNLINDLIGDELI